MMIRLPMTHAMNQRLCRDSFDDERSIPKAAWFCLRFTTDPHWFGEFSICRKRAENNPLTRAPLNLAVFMKIYRFNKLHTSPLESQVFALSFQVAGKPLCLLSPDAKVLPDKATFSNDTIH